MFEIKFKKAFIYLLPAIVFVFIFFVFPLILVIPIGFFEWDGITKMSYVGIKNFNTLVKDVSFQKAFTNTIKWILAAVFLHVPIGLLIALMLNRKPIGWSFLRSVLFLPNILSISSIAILWYFLLHPNFGLINGFLNALGLSSFVHPWLSNPSSALIATQFPFIIYIGFTMLVFLSNLSTIPYEYYEAAEIDGASAWQQDLYISIPLLRRSIAINIIFNVAFCLKMIEYPLIMTEGGPAGQTMTLPLYLYQQMSRAHAYGITMAASFITFAVGICMIILVYVSLYCLEKRWGQ